MSEILKRRTIDRDYYKNLMGILKTLTGTFPEDCSVIVYGSSSGTMDNLKPGLSDIDAIINLNYDFVTDKSAIRNINSFLTERLNRIDPDPLKILVDISIVDTGVIRNGRFIPYGDNFSGTLRNKELYGKEFRNEIHLIDKLSPLEYKISGGLMSLRKHLLLTHGCQAISTSAHHQLQFTSMHTLLSLGRRVADLIDHVEVESKSKGVDYLIEKFPDISIDPIAKIREYNKNVNDLTEFLTFSQPEVHSLLLDGLTTYEQILKQICKDNMGGK